MADVNKVNYAYIEKWEGKTSKDPRDPAAINPAPGTGGIHTNKGVTWATFIAFAKQLNYPGTVATFLAMTKPVWLKIYKVVFWDFIKGDKIQSQAIAELFADFVWGSGPTAIIVFQKYLNTLGYNIPIFAQVSEKMVAAINAEILKHGKRQSFINFYNARLNWLKSSPLWATYGTGWLKRLEDIYAYGLKISTSAKETFIQDALASLDYNRNSSDIDKKAKIFKYWEIQCKKNGVKWEDLTSAYLRKFSRNIYVDYANRNRAMSGVNLIAWPI